VLHSFVQLYAGYHYHPLYCLLAYKSTLQHAVLQSSLKESGTVRFTVGYLCARRNWYSVCCIRTDGLGHPVGVEDISLVGYMCPYEPYVCDCTMRTDNDANECVCGVEGIDLSPVFRFNCSSHDASYSQDADTDACQYPENCRCDCKTTWKTSYLIDCNCTTDSATPLAWHCAKPEMKCLKPSLYLGPGMLCLQAGWSQKS